MKISSFKLNEEVAGKLPAAFETLNNTYRDYPVDKTVNQLFEEIAKEYPERLAFQYNDCSFTYQELDERSNQVARFLIQQNIKSEEPIAVLLQPSGQMIVALLGILKAGGTYVSFHPDFPFQRLKYIIEDTQAQWVLSEKKYIKLLNKLQWECDTLNDYLCLDSDDPTKEKDSVNELGKTELWDYIGEKADDDIQGGGWVNSYTGEDLSREVMDEYGDNILHKLTPLLKKDHKVLEVGCSSGISMFRLAPLVESYVGVDHSREILKKTQNEADRRGIENIRLHTFSADQIDQLEDGDFDVIIINSVIQCFDGHNYLHNVLSKALSLLKDKGMMFIGDIMDQDSKEDFIQSLKDFKRENPNGYTTKLDWSNELFISRKYFHDLQHDFQEIISVEHSGKISSIDSELSLFRFDTILNIDKSSKATVDGLSDRNKRKWSGKDLAAYGKGPVSIKQNPTDCAYITYTSGTTGVPKGVLIRHKGINRLVRNTNYINIQPEDRIAQTAPLSFDASTLEIWGALLNGASAYHIPKDVLINHEEFGAYLEKYKINFSWLTSSLFNNLVDGGADIFAPLETLIVGGEALSAPHINKVKTLFPSLTIINGYGPTENTTFSATFNIALEDSEQSNIPIGKPIANSQCYIVKESDVNQILPVGIPGELCLSGDGLAKGYLNDTALTASKFVDHPFKKGEKLYRTGDRARLLSNGNIQFLGRIDDQVKVRGYRIELKEIECQLSSIDGVNEVAVLVEEDELTQKRLVAYLVIDEKVSIDELKVELSLSLPAYMVPQYFISLDALPLTDNGKLNRKLLPKVKDHFNKGEDLPTNDMERKVADIWSRILDIPQPGIHANFFECGGHSLKATQVISKILEELNVKVSVRELFTNPTIAGISKVIAEAENTSLQRIDRVKESAHYEVSHAQKRMWILNKMTKDQIVYNMPGMLLLKNVNKEALFNALHTMIKRHEALRTTFALIGDQPVQKIQSIEDFDFSLNYEDLTARNLSQDELEDIAQKEAQTPFDLEKGPIFRVKLVQITEAECAFIFTVHHIVSDGWSMGLMVKEVFTLYDAFSSGQQNPLPELPIQYKDYAHWQKTQLSGEALGVHKKFWLDHLKDLPAPLELPTDFDRPKVQSFEGGFLSFDLEKDTTEKFEKLCKAQESTHFMVFLAMTRALFYKYTGQTDMTVGSPVSGRVHRDLENLIGFFVNMIVIRGALDPNASFSDYLAQTKAELLDVYEHQTYPYDQLISDLNIRRDIGRNPLFDMAVTADVNDRPASSNQKSQAANDTSVSGSEIEFNIGSKFDLLLRLIRLDEEHLQVHIRYNSNLFEEQTIGRLKDHLLCLINDVLDDPSKIIEQLKHRKEEQPEVSGKAMGSGSEKENIEIQKSFNNTRTGYPRHKTLIDIFDEQVKVLPKNIALQDEVRSLTYHELSIKSNAIASFIKEQKIGKERIIALLLDNSIESIIGILGILRSGNAYLPIDAGSPYDRIKFLLDDTKAPLLISQRKYSDTIDALQNECEALNSLLYLDVEDLTKEVEHTNDQNKNDAAVNNQRYKSKYDLRDLKAYEGDVISSLATPQSLAYIIYTSGSTGTPKGCMITHENVVRLIKNDLHQFDFSASDVWVLAHAYNFDFSVWEIFGSLLNGAKLMVPAISIRKDMVHFTRFIRENGVTVLNQTPLAFRYLSEYFLDQEKVNRLSQLRYIIFGGDRLEPSHLKQWIDSYPLNQVAIINMYGITETTVHVTYKKITYKDVNRPSEGSPIGVPLPETTVYICDEDGRLLPVGEVGELFVGGTGVCKGYFNNAKLTKERFVINPDISEEVLYRTGDKGRWLEDGSIEFFGRIDNQIKVRGYRIELGEIQRTITNHPAVEQAYVMAPENKGSERSIIAYYIAEDGLESDELRQFLNEKLPDYMVPTHLTSVDQFPMSTNGKINAKALPLPETFSRSTEYQPATNALEASLVDIWEGVLDIKKIGILDDFYELGGDSIKAIRISNKIQELTGGIIHITMLFEAANIKELASNILKYQNEADSTIDENKIKKFRDLISSNDEIESEGPKNKPAVFILSPPRSGSTLLRAILSGHSQLFSPPELELLGFSTLAERKKELEGTYSFFLEGAIRALMELHDCDADHAKKIMIDLEEKGTTVKEFYALMQGLLQEKVLVDKSPNYAYDPRALERMEAHFELPKYIVLQRHPYGMINSFENAKMDQIFRHKHDFTLRELAELVWLTSYENINNHLAAVPDIRKYVVKYEDLVRNPDEVIKGICDFLDIPFEEGMLNIYGDTKGKMLDGIYDDSKMIGDVKFSTHQRIEPKGADLWKERYQKDFLSHRSLELTRSMNYLSIQGDGQLVQIDPIPLADHYETSHAQKRMWILNQFEEQRSVYNSPMAMTLEGLRVDAFQQALEEVVKRHEILRTTFVLVDDELRQKVTPFELSNFELKNIDLRSDELRYDKSEEIAELQAITPFDLEKGPLARAVLIQLEDEKHLFIFNMHHIISDGWSMKVLAQEMTRLYNAIVEGTPNPLMPLRIQYKDYAYYQNRQLEGESLKEYQQYWHDQFSDELPVLDLPTDFERPRVQTFRGEHAMSELDSVLSEKLKKYSQQQKVSLFTTLLSVVELLFYKYTGQEDITIGTPATGRNHPDLENQLGFYVNTLGVRTQFKGDEPFERLLQEVNTRLLEAQKYQLYPFDRLVEELGLTRDVSRSPMFDVMVTMQNIEIKTNESLDLKGVSSEGFQSSLKVSKFDLSLVFNDTGDNLVLSAEYNVDLFSEQTIQRLLLHYQHLAEAILTVSDAALNEFDYLGGEEKGQLNGFSNYDNTDYPKTKTVHGIFEGQVSIDGHNIVLVTDNKSTSYHELNEKSNKLAHYLIQKEVQKGERVGVLLSRSENMLVTLLAIMKAGAAYVPIDPLYPVERTKYIVEDSGIKVLISESDFGEIELNTIYLDVEQSDISQCPSDNLSLGQSTDPIYCIYTSGSTGKPKGVVITHRSVVNFLTSMQDITGISSEDEMLAITTYCFDISVLELFLPLVSGAKVILADDAQSRDPFLLKEVFERQQPSIMQATPTMWKAMVDAEWQGSKTLTLLCGGEALPKSLGEQLMQKSNQLLNMYGPTETTIWSTYKQIEQKEDLLTIGKAIANTGIFILNTQHQPVGINVPGELCISGDGLAQLYLNRPELTAEKFINITRPSGEEVKVYRTGDLAKWREDGEIIFLGRIDQQVKVRGHRIELKEIEHVLLTYGDVDQAIATVKKDQSGEPQIIAYIKSEDDLSSAALRSYLVQFLPGYMIPGHIIQLQEVPLTANLKIDYKALPIPEDINGSARGSFETPKNQIQQKVLDIWTTVLNKSSISIHDNFFELGGHSLKATQFVSRVRRDMKAALKLSDVFLYPTIESISACIAQAEHTQNDIITPVPPADHYEISHAQKRLWVLNKLQKGQFAYNMPGAYLLGQGVDKDALEKTFQYLINRHETLRTTFIEVDGEPRQKVHTYESLNFNIEYIDVSGDEQPDDRANELVQKEAQLPFDLSEGPLIRIKLLHVADNRNILLYTLHHIISDGWSLRIFFEEAISLYTAFVNGGKSPFRPLRIQYKDYVHWQNNINLTNDESYWLEKLSDVPEKIQLPYDYEARDQNSFNGASEQIVLNAEIRKHLLRLAFDNSTTLSNTIFTILNVLLNNISGQDQLLVGTALANRNHVDTENMIGFFVNPLVILTHVEEDASFEDLLGQVTQHMMEAADHQNYPFDLLVEKIGVKGADHKQPLFNVFYGFQNFVDIVTESLHEQEKQEDNRSENVPDSITGVQQDFNVSRFDLTLFVVDSEEGISLKLEYNSDRFKPETIKKYLSYFEQITQTILEEKIEKELLYG